MLYFFDQFSLDSDLYELRKGGQRVHLQPKPLDLLMLLVEDRNRVVSKDELLSRLWPGVVVSENALAQAISCVREALKDARGSAIANVRARGYRFLLPVLERSSTAAPRPRGVVVDAGDDGALAATLARHGPLGTRVVRMTIGRDGDCLAQLPSSGVLIIEHLERAGMATMVLFCALARARAQVTVIGTCDFGALDEAAAALLVPLRVADSDSLCAPPLASLTNDGCAE